MDSYMDLTMPQLLIPSFIFHLSSFIFRLSSFVFHLSSFIFRLSSFVLRRITSEELENPIFPKIPPYNH